jgi:hypothetical protein
MIDHTAKTLSLLKNYVFRALEPGWKKGLQPNSIAGLFPKILNILNKVRLWAAPREKPKFCPQEID